MSQGDIQSVNRVGINYENMPIGKKSVLVPINVMNGQLDMSAGPPNALSKINLENAANNSNSSTMINRKNNRTLKPLQR